jgi:hypothetical protein
MITVHVYYANQLLFKREGLTYDLAQRTPRTIMLDYGPEHYNGAYIHWEADYLLATSRNGKAWFRGDLTPIETEAVPAETRLAHFLIQ